VQPYLFGGYKKTNGISADLIDVKSSIVTSLQMRNKQRVCKEDQRRQQQKNSAACLYFLTYLMLLGEKTRISICMRLGYTGTRQNPVCISSPPTKSTVLSSVKDLLQGARRGWQMKQGGEVSQR
jgi:hypothetical protein